MKMVIKQILNTNAVISNDENGQDVLLLGSGLGFKSHIGDMIDQERVEKQFILKDKDHKSQFREILETVPQEYIMVAEDVIDYAVHAHDMTLNETIHISLVDHIYHAVENFQQGIVVPNSILHDIIRFYPDEYEVGQKMLEVLLKNYPEEYRCSQKVCKYIEDRYNYKAGHDELIYLAVHLSQLKNS